jgi:tetratricopeptide (TPR) repeat protein
VKGRTAVHRGFAVAVLLVAVMQVPALAQGNRQEAVRLNNVGYKYYQTKDYANAANYFRQAIKADDTYLYPHYNLACTLSLMLALPTRITGLDDYQRDGLVDEAIQNLQKTLQLEPGRKSKIESDSDLVFLRTRAEYYVLLDYSLSDPKAVQQILSGVSVWGLPEPLDPQRYRSRLRFTGPSKLEISNLFWEGNTYDYTAVTNGSYTVEELQGPVLIHLTFEKAKNGKKTFDARIELEKGQYKLYIEGITTEQDFVGVPFVANLG